MFQFEGEFGGWVEFARETIETVVADMLPLIGTHYQEIAPYKEIPLQPDVGHYRQVEAIGALRIYTARDADKHLRGYALFFLRPHPHFHASLQAAQDLLFIDPDHRGFGLSFLRYCDEQLAGEGVEVIHHTVTTRCDFSPMLRRMGYQLSEFIYTRHTGRAISP